MHFRWSHSRPFWVKNLAKNRMTAEPAQQADLSNTKIISDQRDIRDTYALYLDDESHSFDGAAERLMFPTTEAEISTILHDAAEMGTPVTIQGGRTGLTGGAVPLGGIALNLEKLDQMLYMDYHQEENMYSIAAETGVLLEDLVEAISKKSLDTIHDKGTSEQRAVLEKFLADPSGYTFPVDPTETSAWLGGIAACNASGARTFRYGAVRDWVRRVRVVLANGDILDIRRGQVFSEGGVFEIELSNGEIVELLVPTYEMPRTKNAAGLYATPEMDLIDLFVGCEGILGVITMVELGLIPLPPNLMTVMAFFPSEQDAVEFVYDIRAPESPVQMDFIEYFGPNAIKMIRERASSAGIIVPALTDATQAIVFFEFSYKEEEMEEKVLGLEEVLNRHNSSSESSWAGLDHTELEKMKTVRHFVPETINGLIAKRKQQFHDIHKIGTDMAVPDAALRDYLRFYREVLEEQGMEYVIFGHIGDNHLHVNMIPRNSEEVEQGMQNYMLFAERAVELGGTVAAEHGIGKLKRQFLKVLYGDKGISQIQAVKEAVDPHWLLNRGNMVPVPDKFQ
ncbi:FAD-binding oxidoreductase [Candidatus Thorarchaeota archaeon]|nr:MAG: FAD-binding oxidoreductase [Candidatus Thorarchaeota archaeon]